MNANRKDRYPLSLWSLGYLLLSPGSICIDPVSSHRAEGTMWIYPCMTACVDTYSWRMPWFHKSSYPMYQGTYTLMASTWNQSVTVLKVRRTGDSKNPILQNGTCCTAFAMLGSVQTRGFPRCTTDGFGFSKRNACVED